MATGPRSGPCSPWALSSDVAAQPGCGGIAPALLAEAASAATNILYRLSGRDFTGAGCGPVVVRPVSRPIDQDNNLFRGSIGAGYLGSWGSCASGMGYGGSMGSHFGCTRPPEVELGTYPVNAVSEVKIDGVVIPPDEYYLQDYRSLVRVRVNAATPPTQRYGWPTCQRIDLPDTEYGTFSVTFTYGRTPPADGILACRVLAAELAKAQAGLNSNLPKRLMTITREGMNMTVHDSQDFLENGRVGIYEVDLFLKSVNPNKNEGRALVWSPDMSGARRMPAGGYR